MKTGLNLNVLERNAYIPEKYLLHPKTNWEFVRELLKNIRDHAKPSRIRTIIWLAERDPIDTPWLHIPLNNDEIIRIQAYAWECHLRNLSLELVLGCLWEARWLNTDDYPRTGPIPDNPFKTVDELTAALQESLWKLLFTGDRLPSGTIIDLYNEFDLADTQEPVAEKLYPWAKDAIHRAGLLSSVSTIVDLAGTGFRSLAAYQWLANLGYGLPDFLELHVNGVPDAALVKSLPYFTSELRKRYPECSIIVGEDDMPRNTPREFANWLFLVAPKEYIKWID